MGVPKMDGLCHGKSHLEMEEDQGYPHFRKPPFGGCMWLQIHLNHEKTIGNSTHWSIRDDFICQYMLVKQQDPSPTFEKKWWCIPSKHWWFTIALQHQILRDVILYQWTNGHFFGTSVLEDRFTKSDLGSRFGLQRVIRCAVPATNPSPFSTAAHISSMNVTSLGQDNLYDHH